MMLTISLAQMRVVRAKPEENLKKGEALIAEAVKRGSGLISFPEMWTTGFDWAYNARAARDAEEIVDAVADRAKRHRIWVTGSMLTAAPDGRPMNTAILFDGAGREVARYSKTHLFSMMREDEHVEAGAALRTVETPWGLVGLSVCYDIRFPEVFRSYALAGARMVLSPMAFPYPRLSHWKVLVRARAIEDQLFMVGTNQVGEEDFGPEGRVTYFGDSCVIDPWGETVIEASETKEELVTAVIDLAKVDEVRRSMRVLEDRRPELYKL